ncbi:MAG: NAD(P)-dependent oxidoreductase [Candidatus Rokubacteria bacterium]|nr:NAD(P)-dependent oxidoreductase [Candidatus Rokubacteria bacterium]
MTRIGFIGLGTMGRPMATNLLKRGFPLVVHDIVADRVAELATAGAEAAPRPRDLARQVDIVITMVPGPREVEAVFLGPDGIVHGARPGSLAIDMSTSDPALTRRVASALGAVGIRMLDAPVGRSPGHAAAGKLLIMVGGSAADLDDARPVFEALGDTIVHCGPIGCGETMKLVNNYLSMTTAVATAEALVLGVRAGLPLETMLQVLTTTAAANAHLTSTFPAHVFRGNFSPGFMLDLAHKDLGLALDLGAALQVPLALGAVGREVYAFARAAGKGRMDRSAVVTVFEDLLGVTVRLGGKDSTAER